MFTNCVVSRVNQNVFPIVSVPFETGNAKRARLRFDLCSIHRASSSIHSAINPFDFLSHSRCEGISIHVIITGSALVELGGAEKESDDRWIDDELSIGWTELGC